MDMLDLINLFEDNGNFFRRVESVVGLHGFPDKELVVWVVKDNVGLSVSVDGVVVGDVWKCFVGVDLEGVWCFVVLRLLSGSVVCDCFVLDDVGEVEFI